MGMSTRVIGLVSSEDETYQKHAKVLRACVDAGIKQLPKETADFFGSSYPDEYMLQEKLEVRIRVEEWSADMEEGYDVKIADLPKEVSVIRFYNSW